MANGGPNVNLLLLLGVGGLAIFLLQRLKVFKILDSLDSAQKIAGSKLAVAGSAIAKLRARIEGFEGATAIPKGQIFAIAENVIIPYEKNIKLAFQRNPSTTFLPTEVAAIIAVESNGDRLAKGAAGEVGLMQITAGALADVNRKFKSNLTLKDLEFANTNIDVGLKYLDILNDLVGQQGLSSIFAIQAYNAGIGNVLSNTNSGRSYFIRVNNIAIGLHQADVFGIIRSELSQLNPSNISELVDDPRFREFA